MKKNTVSFFILGIALSVGMFSCGGEKQSSSGDEFADLTQVDSSGKVNEATGELAIELIKSIPPPVEISAIIKNSGAPYLGEMLNSTDNYEKYTTNFQKAVNLGIYGAELGYINMYNQKQDALTYLNTVVKLSEDLKVGQYFDFETIRRIANNNQNLDSLVNITTSNFEKMNNYLQEQNRTNMSMYMLSGGWIEALYIACHVSQKQKSKDLSEKIGEQKIVLDQLIMLLSFYKNDPNAIELNKKFIELKAIYNKVKIETIYAEPTMVEENGNLVVKDNSTTNIIIDEAIVKEISDKITAIRNSVIG